MAHSHGHSHVHDHAHHHGATSAHPPQRLRWSILRMTMGRRLFAVLTICACLWALVFLAMVRV